MSKGVQGGNRRRATGRVTPSKLRRSAVIAVDGVLAISTGAIGGLFAAGTGAASAAAPPVGWSALQSPTTITGPDAPNANPETEMQSTSCASAVFCVAGGDYVDSASNGRGLLETLAGGTWSAQEAPLPSDAGPDPAAIFKDVSCPTAGWCVAVGGYLDMSDNTQSTFDVLSGGHWTATEAPAPSDLGNQVQMYSVSCPAPGSCTAVGNYVNTGDKEFGLIDTLSNGQWTAQIAPEPKMPPPTRSPNWTPSRAPRRTSAGSAGLPELARRQPGRRPAGVERHLGGAGRPAARRRGDARQ